MFSKRKIHLDSTCAIYTDPYRAESESLSQIGSRLNQFTYFTLRDDPSAVCSVHKTGSNSWGAFMVKLSMLLVTEEEQEEEVWH